MATDENKVEQTGSYPVQQTPSLPPPPPGSYPVQQETGLPPPPSFQEETSPTYNFNSDFQY